MKAIITKFKEDGKHKGKLNYTMKDGRECFQIVADCLIQYGGTSDVQQRRGFVALGKNFMKMYGSMLKDGADLNKIYKILGFKPVTVVYDKSLDKFYAKDKPVLTPAGEVSLTKDGEEFYRNARVVPVGTGEDRWIDELVQQEDEKVDAEEETIA